MKRCTVIHGDEDWLSIADDVSYALKYLFDLWISIFFHNYTNREVITGSIGN